MSSLVGSDASGQAKGTAYGLGVYMEIHALIHECGVEVIDALKGATSLIADRLVFVIVGELQLGGRRIWCLLKGM